MARRTSLVFFDGRISLSNNNENRKRKTTQRKDGGAYPFMTLLISEDEKNRNYREATLFWILY